MAIEIIKSIDYNTPKMGIIIKIIDSGNVILEKILQSDFSELTSDEINNFTIELQNRINEELSNLNSSLSDSDLNDKLDFLIRLVSFKVFLNR